MHNACIGGLGNTSSLPIVMINVVFENTPFWALVVYGRILKAPIPQYTAVYLEYTAVYATTKPTPDTLHSPTPGQLHVPSVQLACTCALCCCYALCMKREELSIFYSLWLRCFVDMLQYVGFLGRSHFFGSQVKVGAPTWHLARANCNVGAPTQELARQFRAPSLELARAKSGFGARQLPHSSCSFAPRVPFTPLMHSLCLLGISSLYYACKATQEGQGEEGDSH